MIQGSLSNNHLRQMLIGDGASEFQINIALSVRNQTDRVPQWNRADFTLAPDRAAVTPRESRNTVTLITNAEVDERVRAELSEERRQLQDRQIILGTYLRKSGTKHERELREELSADIEDYNRREQEFILKSSREAEESS